MSFEQYTTQLQQSIEASKTVAKEMKYDYVGSEHLLVGMLQVENSVAAELLKNRRVKEADVIDRMAGSARPYGRQNKKMMLSPKAESLLEEAVNIARFCHEEKAGTEHLLLAIIKDDGCGAGLLLQTFDIDFRKLMMDILYAIGEDPVSFREYLNKDTGVAETTTIDRFGRDFTKLASEDKLEPIIGRQDEILRMIQILCRKTKNNPCLVGEAGVGKTAIVEGLARKLNAGDVPPSMMGKRLIGLELSGVVAGTKYRGEFEERIQNIIREVRNAGNIILFIDEIHTMIGAGGAEGALDASNILKPALARGELQLIGATTLDEYRKHIEKDPALERRFQPVEVEEPSEQSAIAMLEGIVDRYERHHRVSISEDAVIAAVKLSARYIHDRFLPDKAIDLMDEAAAAANIRSHKRPAGIEKLQEEIIQLEQKKEQAMREDDFAGLSELMETQTKEKKKLERLLARWESDSKEKRVVVTEQDIAELVSKWTGIPAARIAQTESERLLSLEKQLHKRIVGQEEAISAVAKAVRRGRVGIKAPNRPIGSFLFLGPTGVGKTELSKALAEAVFGTEEALIRVDMSEYMEKHSVSKLIGSPPGYVGYDEGGQLSERVRRHPYSVILFDEVEKAHPDVWNMLLQVLDDGILTDAHGKKISFANTILIMTSNVGASRIMEPKNLGFMAKEDAARDYAKMKETVMKEVKLLFRPEFINRIDECIVFHPMTENEVSEIASILLKKLGHRLKEQKNLTFRVMPQARVLLAQKGYDHQYGARPLRRVIQSKVEDEIATMMLDGSIQDGDQVTVTTSGENIKITSKRS